MSRLLAVRRLAFAALATTGIVLACRAPGEAPPLAPRPDPVEPSTNPVPGAPDPIDPSTPGPSAPTEDAGVPLSVVRPPIYKAQAVDGGVDGAVDDGGTVEDADLDDAAVIDDALDPGLPPGGPEDAGEVLPPVPDADLPPDGGQPFR